MSALVTFDRTGDIAHIALNRPERLNALTFAMWQEVGSLFETLNGDDNVRCIVLGAAGGKAFAPGADIAEFAEMRSNSAQARAYGVLPPDAKKSGEKSVSDSDPTRITCNAEADNATFTLIANVPCDDAKDDKCLLLQKVTKSDGTALYDTQNI